MEVKSLILSVLVSRPETTSQSKPYTGMNRRDIDLLSEDINELRAWLSEYSALMNISVTFVFEDGTHRAFVDGDTSTPPEDPRIAIGDASKPIPMTEEQRVQYRRSAIVDARLKLGMSMDGYEVPYDPINDRIPDVRLFLD